MLSVLADCDDDAVDDIVQQVERRRAENGEWVRTIVFVVTLTTLLCSAAVLFANGADTLIIQALGMVRDGASIAVGIMCVLCVPLLTWALWFQPSSRGGGSVPRKPKQAADIVKRRKEALQQLVRALDSIVEASKKARRMGPDAVGQATGERGAAGGGMDPELAANLSRLWTTSSGQEMFIERSSMLHNAFVIVVSSNSRTILAVSQSAARRLGFHPDEPIGHPLEMLVDEAGAEEVDWCVDTLLNTRKAFTLTTKAVRFTSLATGTVQMNLHLCRVYGRDGRTVGIGMIGSEEMRLESTSHVFLTRYRLAELSMEIASCHAAFRERDRVALDAVLPRVFRLVKSLQWNSISLAAHQLKNWKSVRSHSMLDTLSRSHMHVADFKFAANLPELVDCDIDGIVLVLTELLKFVDGRERCSIDVSTRLFDQHYCLQFTLSPFIPPKDLGPLVDTFVSNLCGTLRSDTTGQITLMCPVRLLQNDSMSTSMAAARSSTMFPTSAAIGVGTTSMGTTISSVGGTLQFALHEPNAVVRHVVSMSLWSHGHAVTHIATPRELETLLQQDPNSLPDCFLLSGLSGLSPMLCREAKSRAAMMYCTILEAPRASSSGMGDSNPVVDMAWREGLTTVPLPLTRPALEALFRLLNALRNERNAKRRELDDKRRVLNTHRGAPWKRGRKLGTGSFAEVFEAESELTGGTMAVKVISLDRFEEEALQTFISEIEILCTLSHPNIVYYFYCEQTERTLNLFMELCHNNSLFQQLRAKGPMSVAEAQSALRQVLSAIEYLHEKGFVHRDIKPANILVARDGTLKLSDFGTATKTSTDLHSTAGTIRYMAPEVYNGETHGTSCDIWSVGVLYVELVGALPADNGLCPSFYSDSMNDPVDLPASITGDAKAFVMHCLQRNPKNRPSATTLLHHPFLLRNELTSVPSFHPNGSSTETPGTGAPLASAPSVGDAETASVNSDSSDLLAAIPPSRFAM